MKKLLFILFFFFSAISPLKVLRFDFQNFIIPIIDIDTGYICDGSKYTCDQYNDTYQIKKSLDTYYICDGSKYTCDQYNDTYQIKKSLDTYYICDGSKYTCDQYNDTYQIKKSLDTYYICDGNKYTCDQYNDTYYISQNNNIPSLNSDQIYTQPNNLNSTDTKIIESNDLEKYSLQSADDLADHGVILKQINPIDYKIYSNITRREMLKIVTNLAKLEVGTKCSGKFSDLTNTDWGCKYAELLLLNGFISPNKKYRPNDFVSKIEAVKMIFQAKKISVNKFDDWREGYISKGVEDDLFDYFNDYNTSAQRLFVFNIISRIFEGELNNTLSFNDINTNSINSFNCGDTLSVGKYTYSTKLLSDGNCWTITNMKHLTNIGKSYCYDSDEKNCDYYGALYNWDGANKSCEMLGDGWVLPSTLNFNGLINLGATGWIGNKFFGIISSLPGFTLEFGNYTNLDKMGSRWTSTSTDKSGYYSIDFYSTTNNSEIIKNDKGNFLSTICIKK